MPKPVRKMQKANAAAQAAVLPKISPELLDQLVKGPMTAEAIDDASRAFKKALIERALGAEMSHHLGYPAGADKPAEVTNQRNGKSGKTHLTDDGPLRIEVPRSACNVSVPGAMSCLAAVSAINASANSALSRSAIIQPTT